MKDAIQNLSQQRDSLIMELQQLQEAKPVLEKAYAVRIESRPVVWSDQFLKFLFLFIALITSKFNAENTAAGNEKSSLATVFEAAAALHGIAYES